MNPNIPPSPILRSELLLVCETFTSLQGESTHAGRVCFFIRLAGCNLRCSYCDTMYAHSFSDGMDRSVDDILAAALASGTNLIEITGGEPLCSADTPALCSELIKSGFEVLLETNGSLPVDAVPEDVCKIVDCKLPSSGMSGYNLWTNFSLLNKKDEVKFVVGDRADFDYACGVIRKYGLISVTPNLIFSPVFGMVQFSDLADWVIGSGLPVRMQVQMHKIIWGDKRGV